MDRRVIGGLKTSRGCPTTRRRRPAQDRRGPPPLKYHPYRRDTSAEAAESNCVQPTSSSFLLRVFQTSCALILRTFGILFARYLTFLL
ncbi:hypothetical protein B9Z55_017030 [Caenorhabditis nigoni]|nr:hypothetical protein B9Z55_017030 [Caenorhabditis nigoni]